jgi:5-oxoprolinase (ATP-hydrolysing)
MPWQFWLDVGGTFTDCIARAPDGKLLRRKVLSSATTKGSAALDASAATLHDPQLTQPSNFWTGYTLRLVDESGRAICTAHIDKSTASGNLAASTLDLGPWTLDIASADTLQSAIRNPQSVAYELVSPEEAPLLAIRLFLGLRLDEPIPPCTVRLGTTRGTNALLTRGGAKTGFVTTRGFTDVLRIGYQNRPKLFELAIKKPEPLFSTTAEIDERISTDGAVLRAINETQVRTQLQTLLTAGVESLSICLLNSYANPAHEHKVEQIARAAGFREISVSHRVSPLMKIVPRGDTTVVDAYLNPVLRSYVERLAAALPGSDVRLMTSAGGLATTASFGGKDSLLSGPAGGVVGFSRAAEAAGFSKAIGFDMGGTSTDVSRYDGRFEYEFETEKAGVSIVSPMLAIETVAAGGGSICKFDGVKLVVGPDSAGADPGPACYGRGGPLTVTDCNLVLGRIVEDHFPFALHRVAAENRLEEVARQLGAAKYPVPSTQYLVPSTGASNTPSSAANPHSTLRNPQWLSLAAGFVRIANANMAAAIRSISLAKGDDPREYTLVAFGAAGPQHACAVAQDLGITRILIHSDAGVLSALGIGLADVIKHRSASVYEPLAQATKILPQVFDELENEARADVLAEGVAATDIEVRRSLDLRYAGTDAALAISEPAGGDYAVAFAAAHQRLYGYLHEGRALEVVAARVEAIGRSATRMDKSTRPEPVSCEPHGAHTLLIADRAQQVPLYFREKRLPGALLSGPAVVVEPLTTTIVDPGWRASVLSSGELLIESLSLWERAPAQQAGAGASNPQSAIRNLQSPDPILLELFNNRFTAIAAQMGITLRNTSISVNVKERLDFSCAIFTADGDLVVNAPHIPVHLGAMSQTVKQIIADNPTMQPGDVFVTNDPYRGGSHLPDVTVITPVFDSPLTHSPTHHSLLFFTASRAHHAEIGGITPGSMPPFSKNLAEEGVRISNFKLIVAGQSLFDELRALLTAGPYPSRSPDTNLADITAQVAANQQGAQALRELVEQESLAVVQAYMSHIQDAAEQKTRVALAKLPPGRREFTDHLDDGTPIHVAITVHAPPHHSPLTTHSPAATIDFTGTGPISAGNLNANPAIVSAAVIYVLRLLIGDDIPLNQGVLNAVELIVPHGLLNPLPVSPAPCLPIPASLPAVAGGNVETSQRVVDVLLGAFGLAAASQGTMNNLLFGDTTFGYYETICGGSGATADSNGADAVHTHMTNTRLTDPEVLEARYPVRVREFSIRRGSGGAGATKGGDGVVRRLEFLQPLTLSILSQRRGPYPPYGVNGGEPGSLGRNSLCRVGQARVASDGPPSASSDELLPALVQTNVQPGDILTIETPGGGGWGKP